MDTAVRFRLFQPADLPACLAIYRANETGRFPANGAWIFEQSLTSNDCCTLVGELDGRVVLTCGVHYLGSPECAGLFYGLIDPDFHGRGLGPAMVLVRLALLRTDVYPLSVLIFAVAKSIGYYRRFGFQPWQPWQDEHGDRHPSAVLSLSPITVFEIRKHLERRGVEYPKDPGLVPLKEMPEVQPSAPASDAPP